VDSIIFTIFAIVIIIIAIFMYINHLYRRSMAGSVNVTDGYVKDKYVIKPPVSRFNSLPGDQNSELYYEYILVIENNVLTNDCKRSEVIVSKEKYSTTAIGDYINIYNNK